LGFTIAGDTAYVYNYDWVSGKSTVMVVNTLSMQLVDDRFIKDGTEILVAYGIAYDPVTGLIYIPDALNFTGTGRVYAFDKAGNRQFSFDTGINPSGVAFLHRVNILEN
jgi:DNA-binding beta-propeller fold protein YncE